MEFSVGRAGYETAGDCIGASAALRIGWSAGLPLLRNGL
jgi:hypothetical protein